MESEAQKYIRFSDITKTEIEWLWYPYIPFGKITVLQGDPGCGKSLLMMDLIARVTTGECLPDGRKHDPINVIYQCSEDGTGDTIKPRMESMGVDCTKVSCINEDLFALTLDDELFRRAIIDLDARLLVIDPFQAYIGDSVLSSATGMRRVMKKLGIWATAFNCAVILVGHLNKKTSQKELYRGLGSVDIMALARSVIQIERSDEDDHIRYLSHVKSNLSVLGPKKTFRIDGKGSLHWIDEHESENADELISMDNNLMDGIDSINGKTELAAKAMIRLLSFGPKKAQAVIDEIEKQNISDRTIKYAKKLVGIESFRKGGQWYWSLPTKDGIRP